MPDTPSLRLVEFREDISRILEDCEKLQPKVKEGAGLVGPINELAARRDRAGIETAEGREANQQIQAPDRKFSAVKAEVQSFIGKLHEVLQTVPIRPPELQTIHHLILGLPLCGRMGGSQRQFSMPGIYQDLVAVRVRLQELLDYSGAGQALPKASSTVRVINVPDGLSWEGIAIRVTSEYQFQIQVGDQGHGEALRFTEAGFEDRRSGKPIRCWRTLLVLAESGGRIGRPRGDPKGVRGLEKRIGELRKRLTTLFGLKEDPFYKYREVGCYKAKFKITKAPSADL